MTLYFPLISPTLQALSRVRRAIQIIRPCQNAYTSQSGFTRAAGEPTSRTKAEYDKRNAEWNNANLEHRQVSNAKVNAKWNEVNNAVNGPVNNAKVKEANRQRRVEAISNNPNMATYLMPPNEILAEVNRILDTKYAEFGYRTLRAAIDTYKFCFYFGTTYRALELEVGRPSQQLPLLESTKFQSLLYSCLSDSLNIFPPPGAGTGTGDGERIRGMDLFKP